MNRFHDIADKFSTWNDKTEDKTFHKRLPNYRVIISIVTK